MLDVAIQSIAIPTKNSLVITMAAAAAV